MKQIKTINAVHTEGAGKQYGSLWALKDCSITVPQGSVSALVGPNGAGKTTLLKMLSSLSTPTAGTVQVLGQVPSQDGAYVANIGYLAQEIPLYDYMTIKDHFELGANLNQHWDTDFALSRILDLGVPLNRRAGTLSGGQRAQLGLTLVLAKKPRLLLLDEPVASLDPLAREEFLSLVAQEVHEANGKLTVLMSSHLLGDLEKICDHLIVLTAGKTQLCDTVDDVLRQHMVLVGPATQPTDERSYTIIHEASTSRQRTLLVRLHNPRFSHTDWQIDRPSIEEIILAYMKHARTQERGKA